MSPEAKEAQREKSKFAMQKRCKLETKEQTALAKDKHREKQRLEMRKKRQAETDEQTKLHNEKVRLTRKRKRQSETEEETKWHRENNRLAQMRKRQAETEEQRNLHRENDRLAKKRKSKAKKEQAANCHSETEEHKDDMEDVINRSKKEAMKFLYRTKDLKNPHKHRAIVCIIYDRCIIGTEAIRKLTKEQIYFIRKGSVLIVTMSIMKQL